MLAFFPRRERATLRGVSPTHAQGSLRKFTKNLFVANFHHWQPSIVFLQTGQEGDEPGAQRGEQ